MTLGAQGAGVFSALRLHKPPARQSQQSFPLNHEQFCFLFFFKLGGDTVRPCIYLCLTQKISSSKDADCWSHWSKIPCVLTAFFCFLSSCECVRDLAKNLAVMIAVCPREQLCNRRAHYLLPSLWQRFKTAQMVSKGSKFFLNSWTSGKDAPFANSRWLSMFHGMLFMITSLGLRLCV